MDDEPLIDKALARSVVLGATCRLGPGPATCRLGLRPIAGLAAA